MLLGELGQHPKDLLAGVWQADTAADWPQPIFIERGAPPASNLK
jgi:hypothetical protein